MRIWTKTVTLFLSVLWGLTPMLVHAKSQAAAPCLTLISPAYNSTPSGNEILKPLSLHQGILRSELFPFYSQIRQHSKGIVTLYDLLNKNVADPTPGFLLGLSGLRNLEPEMIRDVFIVIAQLTGKVTWMEVYRELGLNIGDPHHTSKFMGHLVASGKDIVFMAPQELYSFTTNGVLQAEANFLLDPTTPQRLQNVTFVVGMYEIFGDPRFAQALKRFRTRSERFAFIESVLNQMADLANIPEWNDRSVDPREFQRRLQ